MGSASTKSPTAQGKDIIMVNLMAALILFLAPFILSEAMQEARAGTAEADMELARAIGTFSKSFALPV